MIRRYVLYFDKGKRSSWYLLGGENVLLYARGLVIMSFACNQDFIYITHSAQIDILTTGLLYDPGVEETGLQIVVL